MSIQYFQFTLGPVQGFVAQARRTRDFWAGSFLLSWLAAVTMKAVEKQGGKIIFPCPDDNTLAWLEGRGKEQPPHQGSVPNRFKAEVSEGFKPDLVVDSVRQVWWALAELVWREDLAHACSTHPKSRAIWERQIEGFWEISWVLGGESDLLDRRKNWRIHLPQPEGGVKCMVMDGWQELSGAESPHAGTLGRFWEQIRKVCKMGKMDLAKDEHLCAIAFVKRRFARCFHQLEVVMPGGWTLRGWELKTGVPSVLYLAAAHWLEKMIKERDQVALAAFVEQASRLGQAGEWESDIRCVREAWQGNRHKPSARELARLDSGLLFESYLTNPRLYEDQKLARRVAQQLHQLGGRDKPAPFYAILLMDGDSLGVHMSDTGKQPRISQALERFTTAAGGIVNRHNGFLVYAGGDDVLAMLPLDDALACAAELRAEYSEACDEADIDSTLSGAIEFAHVKMPLTRVLRDAHDLLDKVAKDGRGRDAIAVRVWKPGGRALEWAMPWDRTLVDGKVEVQRLADEFARESGEFSSKFFYKIRERFALLNPKREGQEILTEEQACTLMAVDYLASGVNDKREIKLTLEDARRRIQPLLKQCRPVVRHKEEEKGVYFSTAKRLEEDGALLVRFLAQKGAEQR